MKKTTTNFEASNPENVMNKKNFDTNLAGLNGKISYIGENYNEFKLHNNEQSIKEALFERAVETLIQMLYGGGLFNKYDNADVVLKDYLFFERL